MAIRGTKDLFGKTLSVYNQIRTHFHDIATKYGAQPIQVSALDSLDLFIRTSGQDADICQKEMFVVSNRNNNEDDNSTVLKPEGTAPTVRALQENGAIFNKCLQVSYFDRMYRYSRPQKGRLREFTQAGMEFFGASPLIDAQAIKSACEFLERCGVLGHLSLRINSLGNAQSRSAYVDALKNFLLANKDKLSVQTYEKALENPLRALDKLTHEEKNALTNLPKIIDYLDHESKAYFEQTLSYLYHLNVSYVIDPTIVRGLDYYSHTVFEFVGENSSSQGTVLAGGRYDQLVPLLTKQNCGAIGWAAGIERLMILQEELHIPFKVCQIEPLYIISLDTDLRCLDLATLLCSKGESVVLLNDIKLDKALKQINHIQGTHAIISGTQEAEKDSWLLKDMQTGQTTSLSLDELLLKLSL